MNMQSKIHTKNLNLFAGKQQILKNINITIPEKKVTTIIGPSGCGKTSLLKCLNRLVDIYPEMKVQGKIYLDNINILEPQHDIHDIRRKMGLLSQRPYPLPMSICNNITFGLRISGRRKKRYLNGRLEHYLRQANLWDEVKDRLKEPAVRLSIGQQQRLCLARGLSVDPDIILADEPTSALDPVSTTAIEERFEKLKSRYTIVMVTHILRQAKRIADHVIFMYLGEVIEQGPAEQVFCNPQHEKTKLYLKGAYN